MSLPIKCDFMGRRGIPPGYTRLEFLESTGGQYINIPRALTIDVDCSFVYKGQNTGGSGYQHAFGTRVAANSKEFGVSYNLDASTVNAMLGGGSPVFMTCAVTEPHEIKVDGGAGKVVCGDKSYAISPVAISMSSIGVFRRAGVGYSYFVGRIFKVSIFNSGRQFLDMVPCVESTGAPCMYDMVTRTAYKRSGSGQFIAGVGTVAQLTTLLRNLPATGGALTLSLPAEANTPEVAEALQACHDTKGWTLTVHEYRAAAAATYSLRRVRSVVWCRVAASEHGSYANVHGVRFNIDRCAAIFGPHGQDPTAYGYTPFDSVEQAAEEWVLSPYIAPEEEPA